MKTFLQYLGIILLLLGVVCLIVYKYSVPENALLITAMALEFVGILCYIIVNKRSVVSTDLTEDIFDILLILISQDQLHTRFIDDLIARF